MEFELIVYLKDKKFSFVADKENRFNPFFEQLYNKENDYVEFNGVTFVKSEFRLCVIKEKKPWQKKK